MKLFQVEVLNTLTNAVETSYILGHTKRSAMKDVTDFKSDNYEVLSVKMPSKEFTKHYLNILNCPYTSFWIFGKYSEKEDYLKNEIQQLADIDKISYPLALEKIYSVFFNQYLDTDLDDSNFKKIENATINLSFLRHFEVNVHKDE